MGFISKVNVDGTTHLVASSAYGVCSTAAGTAAKVVTMSDFNALIEGVTIHVYFANSNTASNPTLNVNSTGAKPIYRYGTTTPGTTQLTSWLTGELVSFTYNKTANTNGCWIMNDWNNAVYGSMTQTQATAGTSTNSVLISPKVLHDTIEAAMPAPLSSYHVTIGNDTDSDFTISHYLNTTNIIVSVTITTNQITYIAPNSSISIPGSISYHVDVPNENSIYLSFSSAPPSNSAEVSIISAIAYSSASDQSLLKI